MSTKEFSDQFDVLYNNITSNQAPGLNEYEKSVFLTKAQEELVKNYFSPKGNAKQDGFDDSPKRQADFSSLILTSSLSEVSSSSKFDARSIAYAAPPRLFLCLNEQLTDGNTPLTVVPISYTEYDRLMAKPYKYPPKYQAWRLTTNNANVSASVMKVSQTMGNYTLITASKYGRPVRFIVSTSNEECVAPTITDDGHMITISCVLGKTLNGKPISNTSSYWSLYLAGDRNVTAPYLENFDGRDLGWFPAIPIGDTWVAEDNVFDLTNPGGTSSSTTTIFEIIGRFNATPSYRMRYVRRPNPIILVPLTGIQNDLTIQGKSTEMTSELSEELHEEILQRAVELAKIAWAGEPTSVVNAGQRSE